MAMDKLSIIEQPSNLGLKEPAPGKEPGVRQLPAWLRKHQFHQLLAPDEIHTLHAPPYRMEFDRESGVLNAGALVEYAKQQASFMRKRLSVGRFPLVIGGDCSILIGNALALKQTGNYGLFYLDGHTDFIEPKDSGTGGAGGMAAAMVAGIGPQKLTNLYEQSPYFRENHVWVVGNREYDEEYERPIQNVQANYIPLVQLRQTGVVNCVNAFLDMVQAQKLDGFWLHIDLDVLDDGLMPAVDSRTPGGLTYEEFNEMVFLLLSSSNAAGMEITILDPDLDPSGKYTRRFVHEFINTVNKARRNFS